ncbi:hypothetical protein P1X14_16290 [Sphingomonas sp. AOB5]|uniref:hypothetical protein n=1 Tax=Sphingomonas sp. AOB5 TaxID=3034017 RepID=UPI0023F95A39|nr:hypothetical protein [Sphingomonas sp. AOB5]MDF7776817.1 hypothetical protein [Sphingomonas sp. AOB5]
MTGFAEHRVHGGNRWRGLVWGMGALALAVPAIAMQFTSEVNWDLADFLVFGTMLAIACGVFDLATRASASTAYRAAVGIAAAAAFLLVWVNLAVGVIGSEDNPANLMFAGVLAVAILGAFAARFRPQGMAWALVGTAVAQLLVWIVALVGGIGNFPVVTAVFVALWLGSALLFRKAARG